MKRTIKFLPLAAMTFVIMACSPKGNAYHVTFDTTGGTWKASQTAYDSVDYKATFTPDEGHALDEKKLAIKVAGATIIDGYTFFDNQLIIDKKMITGDVAIRATADALTYGVNFKVEGVVPSYNKPTYHKEFVCNVTNSYERYLLPTEFHVAVNGTELKEGVTYTRGTTGETGKIVVDASKVEGDITISGNPIKSAQVTFNGNGGKWGIDDSVDVYLPEGSTFRDAKTKAGNPTYEDSQSLRRWVIKGTDKTVSDDMVLDLNNPLEVEAKWETKTFSLNIEDSYRYFPTDYYRKKIDYGVDSETISFDLTIDPADQDSHYLPANDDGIEITMATSPSPTTLYFTYTPKQYTEDNRVVSANLILKGEQSWQHESIKADITVKILATPYQTLNVTFDPGDGKFADSPNPTTITLTNDKYYTVLEASLKAGKAQMPVPNNPSRVFKCWTLDGEDVEDNKFINSSVTYKAKYADITFENDTWEHVIDAANQGLPYLFNRYSNYNETNIIGAQRSVLIGNENVGYINVVARVIGINHDQIVGGENAKAALTFEFQDTFGQGIVGGDPVGVVFSNGDRDYENSTIRTILNDETNGLLSMVPDVLKQNIKSVYKTTVNQKEEQRNLADKLFLLSANEIGLTQGYLPDPKTPVKGEEGSTYAYYNGAQPTKRAKGTQILGDKTYWIRSLSTLEKNAYAIDEEGICINQEINVQHGVAPAFAIGVAEYAYSTIEGTGVINYENCNSMINTFKVAADRGGEYYALKVSANDGYIFDDNCEFTVTNGEPGYKVCSDDGSTLTCSFKYTAEQVATKNPIAVTIKATTLGKSARFNLSNCTTAKDSFSVVANQEGTVGTKIEFTAMDGYSFNKNNPVGNLDYDGDVYEIENATVTDDLKTLTCDITYNSIDPTTLASLDLNITVNTQVGELSYVKLNAENCDSQFAPVIVKTEDSFDLTVTAKDGCEFEKIDGETLEEQYKRSISVSALASMGVAYKIEEVIPKQELKITLTYKATGDQLSDITINAIASKNATCVVDATNCFVDGKEQLQIPYYCGKSVTFNFTATVVDGYTFLDLYDTEIVIFKDDTLRGTFKTSVSVSEDGKTANITITLDGTATREGNKLGFSVNPREAK